MNSSQRSPSSEAPMHSDCAPQLLRFFQLLNGDQAVAEKLTIDTLVESADLAGVRLSNGMPAALVYCAVRKASAAPDPSSPPEDKLVLAVQALPRPQRMVVGLFRGLGLPLEEVATIIGASVRQSRRLCADGLLAIHRSLATADASSSTAAKHIGEIS